MLIYISKFLIERVIRMAIFLVQHGIAASKDVDPEKGISPKGVEETRLIADVAKGYGVPVEKIFHSGKKRALQTADIFQKVLGPVSMDTLSGINPLDDARAFSACLDPSSGWMVVGHLPFMGRLVSFLTTGSEDIMVYQFQNSGIACLDAKKDEKGQWNWFIKWTLNPNIP